MNKNQSIKLATLIQEIANENGLLSFPVMSGTVVPDSVDIANGFCSVQLSISDKDTPTGSIILTHIAVPLGDKC